MKKLTSLLMVMLCVLLNATAQISSAYSPHPFSVAAGKQVTFSPGNLQCSGVQSGTYTWAFAANQWEVLGEANVTIDASGNAVLADKIDLFGYSTYANATWGISTSTDNNDYSDAFVDWGSNVIGTDKANTWYTLTCPEWQYLLGQRANAASLFAFATVNNVSGIVILPNDWVLPAGASFTPSSTLGVTWGSVGYKDENKESHYADNVYTAAQWQTMEAAGAVFLPAAGWRTGAEVSDLDKAGYWAKYQTTTSHLFVYVNNYACNPYGTASPLSRGNAVRLVKEYEMPREYVAKPITINMSGKQVLFSAGNLMHSIKNNEWYFASKQTDYIGEANVTTDATGTQVLNPDAIDLFGWSGTGSTAVSYGVSLSENESDYGLTALLDYGQNSIESYAAGTYRTLSSAEWKFLLRNRPNAKKLCGLATVGTTKGLVVLPDEWVTPAGLTWVDTLGDYTVNVYTSAQWTDMEKNGAVFLPAAGYRVGGTVNTGLWYRTSTENTGNNSVYSVWWKASTKTLSTTLSTDRYYALPVRLAQDLSTYTVTVQQAENGTVSADTTPAEPGTTIVVTANADAGYSLKEVVVKRGVVGVQTSVTVTPVAGTDNQYQFTMPSAIVTISAVFVRTNHYAPKLISVAADKLVRFSQGNLHYKRNENVWSFAANQYDTIGANNIMTDPYSGTLELAEEIDLFGWSGSTATAQYGVSTSTNGDDYSGTFADWGKNKIGEDAADTWRTLTPDEWYYIIRIRENADQLFAFGTVNGVKGLILLPDQWQLPQGLTFNTSSDKMVWTSTRTAKNASKNNSSHNTYTLAQWDEMEAAGAVFLPMGGWRNGTAMLTTEGEGGSYWMAYESDKLVVNITEEVLMLLGGTVARLASNVRLVKDAVLYSITMTTPENGTLAVDMQQGEYQDVVTVTATPENGYLLRSLDILCGTDRVAYTQVDENTYQFSMPQGNVTVAVVYAYPQQYVMRPFSVGADKQVVFAQGNLQYTQSTKSWEFAAYQYDALGTQNLSTFGSGSGLADKIDLFGWGTGNAPTKVSETASDYATFTDWGINPIGNDAANTWRTPTYQEWNYLLQTRENATDLYGYATVNGTTGAVLLPDDWTTPDGIAFTAAGEMTTVDYTVNTYTLAQWAEMEAAGAVFLPASAVRVGAYVLELGGYYWSSTPKTGASTAYYMATTPKTVSVGGDGAIYFGMAVRMVQDVAAHTITLGTAEGGTISASATTAMPGEVITITAEADEDYYLKSVRATKGTGAAASEVAVTKTADTEFQFVMPNSDVTVEAMFLLPSRYDAYPISVSSTRCIYFSRGNLQCTDKSTWQFAENQYDIIGSDNVSGAILNKTIDLFGWSGEDAVAPWGISASVDNEDYKGDFVDWGDEIEEGNVRWRTPTLSEWDYLFFKRENAESLHFPARVAGVGGTVILPDMWNKPQTVTYDIAATTYADNTFSAADWAQMEENGAVFLPAEGYRMGTTLLYSDMGCYHCGDLIEGKTDRAHLLRFENSLVTYSGESDLYVGASVRLVRDPKKTDTESVQDDTTAQPCKILYDGQVYILHNGNRYNVLGIKVK